jgi:hypothetical protein
MWWMTAVALAANPWMEMDSDVVAEGVVSAPRQVVYDHVLDLENFASLMAESCVKKWAWGASTSGLGAMARVTYVPSIMHRRLTLSITRADEPRVIDYDHEGNRGFVTRWTFEESGGATSVKLTTYVTAPGWPFLEIYHLKVKPAWTRCYVDAIEQLNAAVGE